MHEEDISLTNELQDDNSDCTSDASNSLTSTMELGGAVDYSNSVNTSTNSLVTHQSSDNQTIKNSDDVGSSSTSFETTKSELNKEETEKSNQDSQLYEQLSQMKPLKPLNFKSSTSICLVNKPDTQTSSISIMPMIDESSSDAKSPTSEQIESKMSSSSTSSLSSSSSNSNNHSENADSASSALNDDNHHNKNTNKNDVSSSSSTCSFSSSGYHSDKLHLADISEIKTEQTPNGVATSMVVIPRRNSAIINQTTNSSGIQTQTSRRVSLSVTDL